MLFVLAPELAPLKCWLAAMTQRYSIREGTNRRGASEREGGFEAEPVVSVCQSPSLFSLSLLPQTDWGPLCMTV